MVGLDGTLCEYRDPAPDLLARAFDELDVDPFFTAGDYREELFRQVVTDETRAERREQAFTALAERAGRDPAVGRRLAALYASMRDHSAVDPTPGALAAVDSLAERYHLALVTNGGPETQDRKLDALGLADAFDTVVYGGYDSLPKPEPAPFHEVLYRLGVTPRRAVHVGSTVRTDLWGADAAGIRAALVGDADADIAPDYRVDSLADLTDPPWE